MYTLIEIFDAKQHENIISPILFGNLGKVIYVGTKEIMTPKKIKNLKSFFLHRKSALPLEFLYVERDNSSSVKKRLEEIVLTNPDCVFDVTGGEDVILSSLGIIASQFDVPIIRIDTSGPKCIMVHLEAKELLIKDTFLSVDDALILQGAKTKRYETLNNFTKEDIFALLALFRVNSQNCEAYSMFCNIFAEHIASSGKKIVFDKNEIEKKSTRVKDNINSVFSALCTEGLLSCINDNSYRINFPFVSRGIQKAGNILEYYTAYALTFLSESVSDIRVSVNIEWNDTNKFLDTQNEIDVLAISNLNPLFISCKNGDVKKDALYELDALSRALGGAYSKKILVCTYISKNKSAREHFLKRAKDMGINVIYDTHLLSFDSFIYYLRKALNR